MSHAAYSHQFGKQVGLTCKIFGCAPLSMHKSLQWSELFASCQAERSQLEMLLQRQAGKGFCRCREAFCNAGEMQTNLAVAFDVKTDCQCVLHACRLNGNFLLSGRTSGPLQGHRFRQGRTPAILFVNPGCQHKISDS